MHISGVVSRQPATMRVLVDEWLDASRVEMAQLELRMSDLNLREVARNAVDDHRMAVRLPL